MYHIKPPLPDGKGCEFISPDPGGKGGD
jgi:hypothetical protein